MQFRGFVCESYDEGNGKERRLLLADLAIDCDSDRYKSFFVINLALTLFTQLIPLGYLFVLFRKRHLLHPPSKRSPQSQLRERQKREREHELAPISFLFTHYELGWWYYEVIESYR